MKPGGSVAWLSAAKAAEHLGYTMKGFYAFVARERAKSRSQLKVYRVHGRLRFRQTDLDRCVEEDRPERAAPLQLVAGGR